MLKLNVIGDPIEHSKSPVVHGMVMDALGISCDYEKILVRKGELKEYIEKALSENVSGFNLTMPHKVDIIPFLEKIDKDAELFGAVNTVKIKDGKLYGYNTDARGFILSLEQNGFDIRNKSIVILGAGGVVSTLALKLAGLGAARMTILNRTQSKAEDICQRIKRLQNDGVVERGVKAVSGGTENISAYMPECDLLINATPLGMSGMDMDYTDLLFLNALSTDALVADLIYNPPKTKFLSCAEKRGNKIMNGLGMLIGQAILADEIYLDKKLDISELFTKLTSNDCVI